MSTNRDDVRDEIAEFDFSRSARSPFSLGAREGFRLRILTGSESVTLYEAVVGRVGDTWLIEVVGLDCPPREVAWPTVEAVARYMVSSRLGVAPNSVDLTIAVPGGFAPGQPASASPRLPSPSRRDRTKSRVGRSRK